MLMVTVLFCHSDEKSIDHLFKISAMAKSNKLSKSRWSWVVFYWMAGACLENSWENNKTNMLHQDNNADTI